MQSFQPPSKPKKNNAQNADSFLEALRGLGSSATQAVGDGIKDFAGDAWSQISGNYPQKEDTYSDFPDFPGFPSPRMPGRGPNKLLQNESELRHKKQIFFERQKNAFEKVVFSKSEQQTKQQIQSVQEELKRLAASTQNLAKEIQIAAIQTPVNPGVYHLNFFEKLKQVLRDIRKRIDQSASWMGAMNTKGKKQGHYWSQVGKSGTKYMLSQERYMSNSAG